MSRWWKSLVQVVDVPVPMIMEEELEALMVGFDDAKLRSLCLDPVTEYQARVDR